MHYYEDKLAELADTFGVDEVFLENGNLVVHEKSYPIVDDIIVLLDPVNYTPELRKRLGVADSKDQSNGVGDIAGDIQFTFGEEWKTFNEIMPEHEKEFSQYFDLVNDSDIAGKRVCDLGCGIGRWSYFLYNKCRTIVLIDFSDAIFVARNNLRESNNALFFMADLNQLPFRDDFADFLFSLGVLHHLPMNALDAVRHVAKYSPNLLIYLYYALDNRPVYFRALLTMVSGLRRILAPIRSHAFRTAVVWLIAALVYVPLVFLGTILRPFGLSSNVPLYDGYRGKGFGRIRQDVYDRFFTRIEQRVSRADILNLDDTFTEINVSENIPYWHFLGRRDGVSSK